MNNENLFLVFEKFNFFLNEEEKQFFSNAEMSVKFSKSKKEFHFFLTIDDFLPIPVLERLEETLLASYSKLPTKIYFTVSNKNYTKDLIVNFLSYIKEKKAEFNKGLIDTIKRENFDYNQNENILTLNVNGSLLVDLFNQHKDYYSAKLVKYGFENIILKANLQENYDEKKLDHINSQYEEVSAEKGKMNSQTNSSPSFRYEETKKNKSYSFKSLINEKPTYASLKDLEEGARNIIVQGKIIKLGCKQSKNTGRYVITIIITDFSSSTSAIYFAKDTNPTVFNVNDAKGNPELYEQLKQQEIKLNDWVTIQGDFRFSEFQKENIIHINKVIKIDKKDQTRIDDASTKRVELHAHTKMSALDGVSSIESYLDLVSSWGHKALAIVDHVNVQSFPDAVAALKKINSTKKDEEKLKLIYGSEVNLITKHPWKVINPKNQVIVDSRIVVFDLETTGLSPEFDEIIEFGAYIIDLKNSLVEKKDILIKPTIKLKKFTTNLTNITDAMLADKNPIEAEFKNIYDLVQNSILVAHNANFDFDFLQAKASQLGYPPLTNTVIDTLTLSRFCYPKFHNHRLGTIARKLGINYDEKIAHRGDYDAEVLHDVFQKMFYKLKMELNIETDDDLKEKTKVPLKSDLNIAKEKGYHINILAKNQEGLKDLYKIVSFSHTENFFEEPKILKEKLLNFKQKGNIILGSGCINGEIFKLVSTGTEDNLRKAIQFYDYVEIQPLVIYSALLQKEEFTINDLKRYLKKIIELAKEYDVLVVASSDAHYTDPELKIIRDVYINTKGLGGKAHPLHDYSGRVKENPSQHLRTTKEMLNEFAWLEDETLINEIVITNPNKIAEMVSANVQPIKVGNFPPKVENVDNLLTELCYSNAHKIYGKELPQIVSKRLEKELNSIIKHGFAVIYWISHKLVQKSIEDGYLVGSRGSVGSSFVATISGITEVNPLKAHYICEKCQFSEFDTPKEFKCGYDLPQKTCPNCNANLKGEGHDIPFETFLGFDGDKVPDIDLNFSGVYQPIAHEFIKTMFGEHNVFRAGTISTVADKTAYGFVKGYFEKNINEKAPNNSEIERISSLAVGVKRTTGQHPGGIIILPKEYEIEDFTPVNYPADDQNSSWLTTHFDFHSIHDNLLKMDLLGHVDPTALKMLHDLTGINPIRIPVNDKKVYSLFTSPKELGIKSDQINGEKTGAIGLPEFGTPFVRAMLVDTKPQTFADLVQISGLSHGTDLWINNAQSLIKNGVATISSVIGCRDDIMTYLLTVGLTSADSFSIMENVRKGKGLTKEEETILETHNIPNWYIESCNKIKYMFPKAHATAYVLMAYRIAWYKLYYPAEYYATYFSTRADSFDLSTSLKGYDAILEKIKQFDHKISSGENLTPKEKELYTGFEVLLEMFSREIKLQNIDFNKSNSANFVVEINNQNEYSIIAPFNTIDSLGTAVANSIVEARSTRQIVSLNDLKTRTQVTQTQIKIFDELGILDSLQNDEQISFGF